MRGTDVHPYLMRYALHVAAGNAIDHVDGLILDKIAQLRGASPEAREAARISLLEALESVMATDDS